MFINKKTELTRVECNALSIVQWCVSDLLPEDSKNKNVFFSEISISTVSLKTLKNDFGIIHGNKYKAIKLKAYFTTLSEVSMYDHKISQLQERPSVKAEMIFRNIGTECCGGASIVWEIFAFNLEVKKHPEIQDDHFYYNLLSLYQLKKNDLKLMNLIEREIRFEHFFVNLFYCSIGDTKHVVSFNGNIVSNSH